MNHMQHSHSFLDQDSIQGWQILGELELATEVASDRAVNKWLAVILSLLDINADFAVKVLKSAQDAVSRALQVQSVVKSKHIQLLILVLTDREMRRHNWGFFRIEKIESESNRTDPDHTIEFYLYQEGL
jgi:hypothetical protein